MANLRTNNLSGEQGQNAYRGSVQFNDDDYLQIADSADIEFGSGDYTVEFWAIFTKKTSSTDYEEIVNKGYPFQIYRYAHNDLIALAVDSNASSYDINATFGTASRGDWHHIAVSRSGNTTKAFLNGIQGLSSTSSTSINDTGSAFTIGAYADSLGSYKFRGVISNVRVVIGTALYTADFTPPTEELTIVDGTAILCCQDSNDPTQEATGKTITGFGDLATAGYLETQPKVIPPVGRDAGNKFGGPIQQSTQGYMYFPTGRTEERVIVNNNFGARGLIMGGITYPGSTFQNTIEFIQISSLGNSVDFGDLIDKTTGGAGFSSKTRGFVAGGNTPDGFGLNVIQFVTIATTGNATDFGDVGYSRANPGGISNNTRGVYSGGESASSPNPAINNIEFITMSTTGNGQDFGDLVDAGNTFATASSPTRGLNMGGYRDGEVNFIDFITIATTGNSQDFGDLVNTARNGFGGVSNGHRGIVMGGYAHPARTNTIQYVTIQSTGNAIDFGDLTDARDPAVTSSLTRGIACTGDYPSNVNIIDFIEIMTTANAVDFGDMLTKTSSAQTCSNAHGGLADDM